jgi:CheY-like chemotaxis protein
LEQKQIDLTLNLAADHPMVKGDSVRLQQVFWNVLKNAVKFTPKAGKVSVLTRMQADGGELIVTITDSGIGLTNDELAGIFKAFAQGEHARDGGSHRFGGLGLGLAISQMLVESHWGSISAASEGRGKGSTFVIKLPVLLESINPEQSSTGIHSKLSRQENQRATAIQVLLVEDHESTRTTLAHLLARRQYQVKTAATVAEARKLAAQQKFDLVISDIGLPDGNGFDLMTELRARDSDLQGIALTGYGMEDDIVRSQSAGFARHLTKPIRVQALDAALAATMPG